MGPVTGLKVTQCPWTDGPAQHRTSMSSVNKSVLCVASSEFITYIASKSSGEASDSKPSSVRCSPPAEASVQ